MFGSLIGRKAVYSQKRWLKEKKKTHAPWIPESWSPQRCSGIHVGCSAWGLCRSWGRSRSPAALTRRPGKSGISPAAGWPAGPHHWCTSDWPVVTKKGSDWSEQVFPGHGQCQTPSTGLRHPKEGAGKRCLECVMATTVRVSWQLLSGCMLFLTAKTLKKKKSWVIKYVCPSYLSCWVQVLTEIIY